MKIGNGEFDTENNTYVMGILNVTPDSFSDGGRFNSIDRALEHAEQMIEEGADITQVSDYHIRTGHHQQVYLFPAAAFSGKQGKIIPHSDLLCADLQHAAVIRGYIETCLFLFPA